MTHPAYGGHRGRGPNTVYDIERQIEPEPNSGCWLWTGMNLSHNGYARVWWKYRRVPAHRLVYELHRGPIPAGLFIDHLCRNRRCVNPWHLEPVTARENLMRGDTRARRNLEKTVCMRGHDAWIIRKTGHRQCRACIALRSKG